MTMGRVQQVDTRTVSFLLHQQPWSLVPAPLTTMLCSWSCHRERSEGCVRKQHTSLNFPSKKSLSLPCSCPFPCPAAREIWEVKQITGWDTNLGDSEKMLSWWQKNKIPKTMKGLEDDAKRGIVISTMKTTGLLLHKSSPPVSLPFSWNL